MRGHARPHQQQRRDGRGSHHLTSRASESGTNLRLPLRLDPQPVLRRTATTGGHPLMDTAVAFAPRTSGGAGRRRAREARLYFVSGECNNDRLRAATAAAPTSSETGSTDEDSELDSCASRCSCWRGTDADALAGRRSRGGGDRRAMARARRRHLGDHTNTSRRQPPDLRCRPPRHAPAMNRPHDGPRSPTRCRGHGQPRGPPIGTLATRRRRPPTLTRRCSLPALAAPFPAAVATLHAIDDQLTEDGYVYRYRPDERPLGNAEGAFWSAPSGWLWPGRSRRSTPAARV